MLSDLETSVWVGHISRTSDGAGLDLASEEGKVGNMKKLHVVLMALVALFAFSAMVTSASAETTLLAEWLENGNPILTLTSTEGTGTIILGDAKVKLKMECTGIFDGSVGANGEDETTELLKTDKVTIVSLANKLACTGLNGCSKAEASPEKLPWLTQAELLENGTFGDIVSSATYWSLCEILGINTEEECTVTNGLFLIKNTATDVEPEGKVLPNGNCTVGGVGAAEQEFKVGGLLALLVGTLAISSI